MNECPKLTVTAAIITALSGCAGVATFQEVPGGVYADYKMARDAEGSLGAKEGRACATSILGWIATGDASIKAAAANGGISKVHSVDREAKNILHVYAEYCTIVRGD